MNILITGARGLLGGRIFVELKKKYNVYPISRKFGYYKNTKIRKINWNSKKKIEDVCKKKDIVIHLAGLNYEDCKKSLKNSYKINYNNTKILFNAAKKNKVKLFIYLSTAHVYKNQLTGKINEKTICRGTSNYALSKLKAENELIKSQNNLTKVLIIRSSNLFGFPVFKKTKCWHLLLNNICKEIINKKSITIKAKYDVFRNYSSIKSFCQFIKYILRNYRNNYKNLPNIINYSSKFNIKISDLVKIIQKRAQKVLFCKIKIKYKNKKLKKSKKLIYKSLFLGKLGYKSSVFFNEEISNLLLYCRKAFNG